MSLPDVKESLSHLREFFTNIIDLVKGCGDQSEIQKKVDEYFQNLLSKGTDCEYYLSAIGYLEIISDVVKPLTLKKEDFFPDLDVDNIDIVRHPVFVSLFNHAVNLKISLEFEKEKAKNSVPRLESLVQSLNSMLSEEQSARVELESKLQKQNDLNRNKIESFKSRINSDTQTIHDLEARIQSLEKENDALAKSKGKNVDQLHNELKTLQQALDMRTEKSRILEEQNRQNLMIYANDISALRSQITQLEDEIATLKNNKPTEIIESQKKPELPEKTIFDDPEHYSQIQKISRTSAELSVVSSAITDLVESLEHRRKLAQNMISTFGDNITVDVFSQIQKQKDIINEEIRVNQLRFNELEQQLKTQKDELSKIENEASIAHEALQKKKDEQELLLNSISEKNNDLVDTNSLHKILICEIESLEKSYQEKQDKIFALTQVLSLDTEKKESLIKQIKDNQNTIDDVENEISVTKQIIVESENNIIGTNQQIVDLNNELSQTQTELARTKSELNSLAERKANLILCIEENKSLLQDQNNQLSVQRPDTESKLQEVYALEAHIAQIGEIFQHRCAMVQDAAKLMRAICNDNDSLVNKLADIEKGLKVNLEKTPEYPDQK